MNSRLGKKPSEKIFEELAKKLRLDSSYKSGRIFSSMCTLPDPFAADIFRQFIERNAGDNTLFPSTCELEKELISQIGAFVQGKNVVGNIVTGGSEANLTALWAARNYFLSRAVAKKVSRSSPAEVIVPSTRHVSIDKSLDLLGLKMIEVHVKEDEFVLDPLKVSELITDKTIAIVGIAGTTTFGSVDPLEELSTIALENNLWLHVDAAFGGFVLPFLENPPKFDFSLAGVKSMTLDPHKMVGSPIPAGCVLFREKEFSDAIAFTLPYFAGEDVEQRTITGTRSGASIITTYAILHFLGMDWLKMRVLTCVKEANFLKKELQKLGFTLAGNSRINAFAIHAPSERNDLFWQKLRERDWFVGFYENFWRFVIMPHNSHQNIIEFLEDLKEIMGEK